MRNVTLKTIEKLARALQVSAGGLLLHAGEEAGWSELSSDESFTGKYVDIVIVEDNQHDAKLTLQAFKQARITNSVQVVHDGKAALDFLFCTGRFAHHQMQGRPQLVLLDLNLPKVGGMEVLRRIKADERTRSIPVVVLTAWRDILDIAQCRRLGAETYIVKPVDFQKLRRATLKLNLNWALLKPVERNTRNVRA